MANRSRWTHKEWISFDLLHKRSKHKSPSVRTSQNVFYFCHFYLGLFAILAYRYYWWRSEKKSRKCSIYGYIESVYKVVLFVLSMRFFHCFGRDSFCVFNGSFPSHPIFFMVFIFSYYVFTVHAFFFQLIFLVEFGIIFKKYHPFYAISTLDLALEVRFVFFYLLLPQLPVIFGSFFFSYTIRISFRNENHHCRQRIFSRCHCFF